MNRALAISLAAVACAQPAPRHPAISELAVLPGTTTCDARFEDDSPFQCRQFPADRAEAIFQYEALLLEQGWRMAGTVNQDDSNFRGSWEGAPLALWLERPIGGRCSERITLHAVPIQVDAETFEIGLFILSNYEPLCGDARKAT